MNISLLRQPTQAVRTPWLVLGIFEDDADQPQVLYGDPLDAIITRLTIDKELTGSPGELTALYAVAGLEASAVLVVGLGPRARFDAGAAFSAGFALAKRLAAKRRDAVAVVLPPSDDPPLIASALIEGAITGTRGPGVRKSEAVRHPFESLNVVVAEDTPDNQFVVLERALRRGEIVGHAVNLARDLVNTPPAEKSPSQLADRIGLVAADVGIKVDIWNDAKIRQQRFGGLLGVAAGSDEPPRFVVLDYRHVADGPTFCLVGKGVTFDSGGLSLKPSASMEDMKSDMTGAAVVVATMQAAARLAIPLNITGYLAITENMTGGKAMKLGDVLTIRNGKTVEVMNTDAEGRLILADALSYAVEQKPDRVLDLATLTGACMVALGPKVAGLFSNDDDFRQDVMAACRRTGERVWGLPLDDDYKEQLKSHVADLKNVGGKWGGAITAAKFLEQFVGSTPWVHLDIAGPSWSDSESATRDAGGTGCFVRSLVAYLEETATATQNDGTPKPL
jgi:leucyl aminopeptidase